MQRRTPYELLSTYRPVRSFLLSALAVVVSIPLFFVPAWQCKQTSDERRWAEAVAKSSRFVEEQLEHYKTRTGEYPPSADALREVSDIRELRGPPPHPHLQSNPARWHYLRFEDGRYTIYVFGRPTHPTVDFGFVLAKMSNGDFPEEWTLGHYPDYKPSDVEFVVGQWTYWRLENATYRPMRRGQDG